MTTIKCDSKKCKNNCCAVFDGISTHLTPFGGSFKFSDIILSIEDYRLLCENDHIDLIEIGNNGLIKLKTSDNGLCSAFKNGKCTIYDYRPTVCRAYPFYIDMFAGLCTIKDCCAAPQKGNIVDFLDDIKAVISVYKKWITYYEQIISKDDNDR